MTYNVRPVTATLLPAGAPGRLPQSSSLSLEAPVGVVCVCDGKEVKAVGLTVFRHATNKVSHVRIFFLWSFYRSVIFLKNYFNNYYYFLASPSRRAKP